MSSEPVNFSPKQAIRIVASLDNADSLDVEARAAN